MEESNAIIRRDYKACLPTTFSTKGTRAPHYANGKWFNTLLSLKDAEGPGKPVVGWGSCNISDPVLEPLAIPPLTFSLNTRLQYLLAPHLTLHVLGEEPEVDSYPSSWHCDSFNPALHPYCEYGKESTQRTWDSQAPHIPKQQPVLRNDSCAVSGGLTHGRFYVVKIKK